jgi:NAD-dependent SIR2 family protein deacetylase
MEIKDKYRQAVEALQNAQALIITAGAGMGVDSGLPDFRGDQGFWKAYPPYEKLGLSFYEAANPAQFERDPAFGWGFYGHRTNLYRATTPHAGFYLLKKWAQEMALDVFVVTSNVDGQFQKAGFAEEQILEVHGSIHHLQCTKPCSMNIWPNRETIPVDTSTMRAQHVPRCIHCGAVARPNILMFGDYSWIARRSSSQQDRFDAFVEAHHRDAIVVIEMGAGSAVPTIRDLGERLGRRPQTTVIRINPREPHINQPHISVACGALEGLRGMDGILKAG